MPHQHAASARPPHKAARRRPAHRASRHSPPCNTTTCCGELPTPPPFRPPPSAAPQIVPPGSMVTRDYRLDRVRIFTNDDGKVDRAPKSG